jgi:D-cysteine desulfhydrase
MDRLGAELGLRPGQLLVKRDDCTGLAGGGNKARKLEYLCADAVAQGCDTLVTGGGRQSNHVRMTAAAANRLGLACTVVLSSNQPKVPTGNVVLDHVLAPDIVWAGPLDYYATEAAIEAACARLTAEGRTPYLMPVGGASTVGALGYVQGGLELAEQVPDVGLVVTADGSGGTHAGLVAALGDHGRVLGVDVGTRPDLDEQVPVKAAAAAALAGLPAPTGTCQVDHDHFGSDYGDPTDECREALDLAGRLEGLVLDPVYSGKAMVGVIAACREGRIGRDTRVVFLHTGGIPALFATRYAGWVTQVPVNGAGDPFPVGARHGTVGGTSTEKGEPWPTTG